MKNLLAAAILLGSTVGATAVESYGDYRDYFDTKSVTVKRAPSRGFKKTAPVDIAADLSAVRRPTKGNRGGMYRYDHGSRLIADMRPRNWDGGYVPVQPRSWSPDGFWGPIDYSHEGREMNQHSYQVRGRRDRAW
ncbi:hypothetical protein SB2_02415 [Methylobacterium radiotolerans]|nr:hypothetical protein SB3_24480 [Methylobacterium radiotolerans]KTS50570.1 hypothetical protein SB2_02415 [Methylobacterium radiotolerans]